MGKSTSVFQVEEQSAEFEAIYSEYVELVYNLCLSRLGNRADAEDAASDTFLWVLQNLQRLKIGNKGQLKVLLMKVAVHKSIDIARKRSIRSHSQVDAELVASPAPTPDEYILQRGDMDRIRQVISTMPEQYKTILLLKYQQNLEPVDIADILKISVEHFRVQLCRAHRLLVKKLGEHHGAH
jgi:RNA polymerase sigma-70 factor (ECF subfamily)